MASVSMAEANTYVPCTVSGAMVLGTMWRHSSSGSGVPSASAAST